MAFSFNNTNKDAPLKSRGFTLGSSFSFPATLSQSTDTKAVESSAPISGPKLKDEELRELRNALTATQPAKGRIKKMNQSFNFTKYEPKLESQWRNVEWTEEKKTSLMKTISSYKPSCDDVSQARILLLGPVGSGKSSFISSVQSVFGGRVTNRAMVGSSSSSFTRKSFNIRAQKGKDPTGLVLCDTMGLGDGDMTGPTLHDILSVIKGHVADGHKFSPDQPVSSETPGYVKAPGLRGRIHCVVFVVDASQILQYPKGLSSTFQQLREHISDLGVHQVGLLTHVDKVSVETGKDVSQVYQSSVVKETVSKAAALLGMSTSSIVPVKNYSSELDLDTNTDVLLLSAVDLILQYADLYFQDNVHPKI
ncbi:interferon-induced protein 44 isoform X2 [Betta splendens]|uniref:Interferon-induced protein 44 isoform X2 n=1 Tax=Betta splendens TaxID=158456 RepID=A0A6P7MDW9_BETSP|nr:interferon-induced protein 44 isoform X2 [Betta splendens]